MHQLIEVKEDCEITPRKETRARISYQRFFRRYLGLAGMTGTAREVADEFWSIYRLRVVTIPTDRPMQRSFLPDRIYPTADRKWETIVETIAAANQKGRPVLVGTRSVEASELQHRWREVLNEVGFDIEAVNDLRDRNDLRLWSPTDTEQLFVHLGSHRGVTEQQAIFDRRGPSKTTQESE